VNTGAFAGTALKLTINGGAQISVNFANDAHAGSAESLANVASYINSTVDAAMGWSSGVQLASVNAAGNGLNLTDTIANSSSVMTVTANATSAALGLTANSSTNNTATAPQAAAITGTAPGTASVNTNAAPTLALNVNGTAVSVNFGNDANKSATESWQNVVNYINSQVDAQMGWGSDVKLAQITPSTSGATSSITLTDPYADSNSTVTVTTGSALLGLATNQTATGTGPVGNTVTLNLAGGNATAATVTGGNTVGPNVNTATGSLTFSIDGTTVNAALTNAGATAAAVTGSSFGSDGTALVNTGSLLTASTYLDTADSLPSDTGIDLTGMNALTINGAVIDISGQAAAGTLQGIVQAINGTAADTFTAGGAVTAKEVTTAGGNYAIQLTSAATGTGAGIAITNNASSQAAGLTNSGQAGTVHGTAGTSNLLKLDINGLGAVSVNFTGDANIQPDGTETLANAASTINAAIDAQYDTETTYVSGASGALVITSPTQGSSSLVSVTSTGGFAAAAQLFGVAGASGSATGKDQTLGSVVASLNTQAQQQMGTATTANIFSLNASNQIVIDSQTKGATSNVALTAVTSTSGTLASDLGLTTLLGDAAAGVSGTGPTTSSIANMLQQAFNNPSNSTLQKAGLQASGVDGGALTISSSNGTNFRIDEYGSVGANLGFGISGGSFTGLTSGASGASMIDAGGTSALGTGTVQNPYLSFAPMKFGSDTQAITISANSAAGVSQPPVTITLQNNGTAQTGATIDSAVSYINSQLRQSNNPTMQSIVAVEENVGGTEQINFLSSSPSFSVSVGNSVNGDGLNAGTAKTFNSVTNGSAGTASIDTLAGAQAAVTAVSAAVAQLGTAQAAVGIGENQVNYAVNLAQSQITNISSAESQIRDANVAQQAANMTKASVLQQATIAAMAQANQEPQAVLSLLKQ
jgi:flagellin